MPNDIAPLAGPGHNQPPTLLDELTDETKTFRERRDALLASVAASRIDSPETAAQVTTLGGMLVDLRAKVEEARKERAKPFDEGKATVQRVFAREIIDPLDRAKGQCEDMINQWRAHLAALEREEQAKRDAAAAEARRAAEEAERKKQEAQAKGDVGAAISAEIEEVQARDRAAALEQDEGTIRPAGMIRTQVGSAVAQTQRVPVVTDLRKTLAYLAKNHGPQLIEAITPLIRGLVRAKVTIPGVEVQTQEKTQFRRS